MDRRMAAMKGRKDEAMWQWMSWRVNELNRGRVGGLRRGQEEEEGSGMIWSSVNGTNDLCLAPKTRIH